MAGGTSGWKIFGIAVIALVAAAAIGVLAFLWGRGCGEEEPVKTTTTRTQPGGTAAPSDETGIAPEQPGGAAAGETTGGEAPAETTATTERYVTGESEGSTPCIGGVQTTTRTTYWSDGSTDTTTITEPCGP